MPEESKKTIFTQKPLLLLAALDWGLGHTTRIIPLIRYLENADCELIVACNSTQKLLLAQEFPSLRFEDLEGYEIKYGRRLTATRWKLLLQLPKILIKVNKEHLWFLRFLARNRVTAVISDNRYGLYHADIPSVLITHQPSPRTGFGWLADKFVQARIRNLIRRFDRCWIPDVEEKINLSGRLSHPPRLPRVDWLGPISRIDPSNSTTVPGSILIILSGPEPQRTIIENRIFTELRETASGDIVVVRGLPGDAQVITIPDVNIFNHLPAAAINEKIATAEYVIARAGYTTIMDFASLRKKLILIPTPGQAEQEYLAKHVASLGIACVMQQKKFSIAEAIRLASTFRYLHPQIASGQYLKVLDAFIDSLRHRSPGASRH